MRWAELIEDDMEPDSASITIALHDTLNPKLWTDFSLKPVVRDKLLQDARHFLASFEDDSIEVKDIILTGSNASFNYTPSSDIDVHVEIDFSQLPYAKIASSYFMAKKAIFNAKYSPTVYGYPVELYPEDTAVPLFANGIYSLLKDEWVKEPKPVPNNIDDDAVIAKADDFMARIDFMLAGRHDQTDIETMLSDVYQLRMNGFMTSGEHSVENLAFKRLRNRKYIEKLRDAEANLIHRELSLESRR